MDRNKLAGLRMVQESLVDEAGWQAATYRWYLDAQRRCLSELSAEFARVLWARSGAIIAAGVTPHLVERECRRAIPALVAIVSLVTRPNGPRIGRLRKVFRYNYGCSKCRDPRAVAL